MQKVQVLQSLRDYVSAGHVSDLAVHDMLVYLAEYAELHWLDESSTLAQVTLEACRALPKSSMRSASDAISMFSDDMVDEDVPPNPADLRVLCTFTGAIFMEQFVSHLAMATQADSRSLRDTLRTEQAQVTERFRRFCSEKLSPFPGELSRDIGGITVSMGLTPGASQQVAFWRSPFVPMIVFTAKPSVDDADANFVLTTARESLEEALRAIETVSASW